MKLQFTTDRILIAVIILLLLSIATVTIISIAESRQVNKTARLVEHTNEVLKHAETLMSSVKDNESGSRGYVLTGQRAFLEQVARSKKRAEEELLSLKALTSDNPQQQQMVDSLIIHANNRIAYSDKNISAYNEQGASAAMELVRTGQGRLISEQVHRFVDTIKAAENQFLEQRKDLNEDKTSNLTSILSICVIGILLLTGFFIQKIRTDYREKKKTAAELAKMNDELELRVDRRTHELAESKRVLSETFERITDAFVSFDNHWNFTYVNKKAAEIFGCTPEELIGKNIWTTFPQTRERPSFKALVEAMDSQHYTYIETHHPESGLWFENHIYPSPGGISVFFKDITEKKRAEEEIRNSEERRKLIINSSLDAIVSIDETGIITSWNPQAEKTFGWKEEELKGRQLTDTIIPNRYREAHKKGMAHYLATGEGKVLNKFFEISAVNKSGNEFPVELTIVPIMHNKARSFTAFIRDITHRKEAEEGLKKSEARYRLLIERISDAFIALDKDWNYTYANKAVGELLGTSPEGLIGKNVWELFPQAVGSETYRLFHRAMAEQRYLCNEDYFEPLDLWQENHVYPSEEGISVFIKNITERKKAEQKILKSNRLYFFISQVNQMIVRTTSQDTLFKEACRIAVELGKFRMAWIGLVDEESQAVVPVEYAGADKEYLTRIKPITIREVPEGMGPTGRAIREGKYYICNDIEADPQMYPWKEDALQRGFRSSMALPIITFGKVIGAFSFYSGEKNFFDESEIALLVEATGDVAFALEVFEKESLRQKAEQGVVESERRYHTLAEVSPVGIFHTDETGYTTYVNPRWCQISGMTYEAAMGNGWFDAVHEEDKEKLRRGWEEATKKKEVSVSEYRFIRPNGSIAWVIGQAIPERDAQGNIIGYVGTTTDITERKKYEKELEESSEKLRQLTAHLINIREEERKRIGREIHDELGQQLTAIKMDVAWISKKTDPSNEPFKTKLQNVITLLDGGNQSIRRILNELRPVILDDYGLVEALRWQAQQFSANAGVVVNFKTSDTQIRVAEDIATCVFRVFQEALTNVTRYAKAKKLEVSLDIDEESLLLNIEDDGVGFDMELTNTKKSFGILGMKERVFSLQGDFSLVSTPGVGTKIIVNIPLRK